MNIAVIKTKAEQALTEQFDAVLPRLPGNADITAVRKAAIGRFGALGLPHRRVEEWKYTDLRAAVKDAFAPAAASSLTAAVVDAALGPDLAALDCVRLIFVNGAYQPALSNLDDGHGTSWHFNPLAQGLASAGFDWLTKRLSDADGPKSQAVVALNTAYVQDGVLLRVEPHAKPVKPFHFVFLSSGDAPASITTRSMVGIADGAEATIIESHIGIGTAARQTNTVLELGIHENARVNHVKITGEGAGATHVATALVTVGAAAEYRSFQFTAGNALVRNQSFVTFEGEGAKIDVSGALLGRGTEHIDATLVVDHAVPSCQSRELFRCVLDDRARGVFQGKIIVRPDAQKTDGKQMAQALMLSPDAEFDAKPELEIYADDVVCGHGATCMELDEDLLFYFRSRGIAKADAKALLITSFVAEAIEKVENEAVRTALLAKAEAWLTAAS